MVVHDEILPCVLVYFRSESSSRFQESPRVDKRSGSLAIEYLDKMGDPATLDDRLDAAAAAIELAVYLDEQMSGCAADADLTETEWSRSVDGEIDYASVRLTFDVERYQRRLLDEDMATDLLRWVATSIETSAGAEQQDDTDLPQDTTPPQEPPPNED
jgi:hypothetical protein